MGVFHRPIQGTGIRAGASAREITLDAEVIDALCGAEPVELQPEEQTRALAACVGKLAPQARRTIELRYQQAFRPPEIARRMGWTVNAVNVALARARRALRDCVERQLARGPG